MLKYSANNQTFYRSEIESHNWLSMWVWYNLTGVKRDK